ncbi:type IV secretion system protein VirB10 [Phenylobacterium sp. Root700]|uniref:type IV secretion system protein VirB10 n=1 Tax=Phenylobacterium sp. Root700 TaxID=1736591 RepID=UPI0006FA97DD|nr:type IV secretion system protein VirB10 [Phenylobacterium sp. Root700]KRB42547.1 hypothetical protein ASE02_21735 [Phenylobacterium sp. Root700]
MSGPNPEDPVSALSQSGSRAGADVVDRTITPVSGSLFGRPALKITGLAVLCLSTAALLAATLERETPIAEVRRDPARQIVRFETLGAPAPAQPGPKAPRLDDGLTEVPAIDVSPAQPTSERTSGGRTTQAAATSSLLIYSRAQREQPVSATGATATNKGAGEIRVSPTELETLSQGSSVATLSARRLPDRNFLIVAGASLPCILRTALDTTAPGLVSCVIPLDILSDNGAVVLLEKGTRVLGEYRSSMGQGQRRVFVLWTRAVTPHGIVVALASPATDQLGRSGFDGDVDNHFWTRFGGALLLSLVDSASGDMAGDDNDLRRRGSEVANTALEATVNIRPTLRKDPGAGVAIFVAHDLDFSAVYGLRSR